ncbi:MAG: tRNA 2-thiouridine(34) synthase MnmA [Actinobacteria bacterium]|nr:tRNA 2-thiouridine(34) synthase MnmA [Actinomycetota bacterium]
MSFSRGYGGKVAAFLASGAAKVHAGRLESPSGVGEAGSRACGSLIRIELAVRDGIIVDVKYKAYGCPATIACGAAVAARVAGASVLAAGSASSADLARYLELPPDKLPVAETAVDALHNALGSAITAEIPARSASGRLDPEGVLVGMSGGVDSAVASFLLQRQGYRVAGITLSLWHDSGPAGQTSCCSPETVRRARRTAHSLGVPHFTVDASDVFHERVVSYFVDEYAAGRTPNPCAKCNALVRFGTMLDVADSLGLSQVATGHYAQFEGQSRILARGADAVKDQSYVLAEVSPDMLRRVVFPLGDMTKSEVRRLAAEAGLEGHAAPESQEICFVTDDDHRHFLRERLGDRSGPIVDAAGNKLGEHLGTYNYTIGQRRGIGIPSERALYVAGINAERSEVVVGEEDELEISRIVLRGLTWHQPPPAGALMVQIRSSGVPVVGRLVDCSPAADEIGVDTLTVELDEPARAVAAGQTAVVYRHRDVVCAGTILWAGKG